MSLLASLTYGPTPGMVAVQRLVGSGPPEVLDSAATIARRTIELPDAFENAGAMLVRDTLLRMHELVGDGGALTAVLLHRLVVESAKYLAGGADPISLRADLESAGLCVRKALQLQARPLETVSTVRGLLAGLVGEPQEHEILTEVLEAVGSDGVVLVEPGQAAETTREYVDGVRWDEGYLSPNFVTDASAVARVVRPAILITDLSIDRVDQLVPLVELCVATNCRQLLIVAPEMRDAAAGLLLVNQHKGVLEHVVAVRAPAAYDRQQVSILEDLAILTGGRCVRAAAGDRLENIRSNDLGSARQAWARRDSFAILGATGDRPTIRARAIGVRAELEKTRDNPSQRRLLEKRLANLSGVAAVVRVGGATEAERDERCLRVAAAVRSGRLALEDGVVPGGGVALLNCAQRLSHAAPAARMLKRAIAGPLGLIAESAGLDSSSIAAQACRHPGEGFDVVRQTWTPTLVDPHAVVSAALEASLSAAATAITAEAVVRRHA
jgi:chaperonin GroEL